MPIRPENKLRYPKEWPAISQRIREREGNRCLWCKAPNGKIIVRYQHSHVWAIITDEEVALRWFDEDGPRLTLRATERDIGKPVRVVLTVAHLDHTPEHCEEENLAALCQRCHNRYDSPMRQQGMKDRAGILALDFPASRPKETP